MTGMSIAVFPKSWAFGPWRVRSKWLFAIGPFRLCIHRNVTGTYGDDRNV